MATPAELDAMRRAIALSAFGLGTTSPNPPVGCVILDVEGRIAGEGYHQRRGESHAEVHALAAAGERAKGGTAVVTLEPCNHHGRTPPCHQALLDAGITRTIVALLDPTSRGEGGVSRLRKAGMDVEVGVLADEALLVLGPWLTALQTCRPHVIWPYTLSVEGVLGSLATIPDGTHLLSGVDAVLYEDGQVAEAVPNSHGEGVLNLAPASLENGPRAVLSTLYQGGVRSVLLDGGLPLAAPFLAERLVDRVVGYLPPTGASTQPTLDGILELVPLPTGFRLTHVTRYKQYVRLSGIRDDFLRATS
jgi:diaminohydroxyphosphoribosylaminopyrimidine deaminase / 5-amino-6-(5-phosphoribosylamino)uracil reductase